MFEASMFHGNQLKRYHTMSKQKKGLRPQIFRPGATALIEDDFGNVAVFIGTDGALNGVFVTAEGREIMSRDHDFYNYLPVDEPGIPPGWTRLESKRYGIVDGIDFTDVAAVLSLIIPGRHVTFPGFHLVWPCMISASCRLWQHLRFPMS
jgi:hypothetical protein